jgi:hypothetical protein
MLGYIPFLISYHPPFTLHALSCSGCCSLSYDHIQPVVYTDQYTDDLTTNNLFTADLPPSPREVAATIWDSAILFSILWGNIVAQCICSHLQLVASRVVFEIIVYRVYQVAIILSFLQ